MISTSAEIRSIESPVVGAAERRAAEDFISPLVLAIWFGVVTGLLEVAVLGFRKLVLHEMIGRSVHFLWMAPLFYVCTFVLLMVPVAIAARRRPAQMMRLSVFALAGAAAVSLLILLVYNRLHNAALLILALGIAVQAARVSTRRSAAFGRLVRSTTTFLVGFVLLTGVTLGAWRGTAEKLRVRDLPPAAAGVKNVLLIILDTVRAANLGLYGYPRPTTPELQRLAASSTVFERAVAPSPWTLPSHASLFTGLPASELSASWLTPLDAGHRTLAETFRAQGYETAGFVANLIFGTWETGLDRGFIRYEDFPISAGQIVMNSALGRFVAGRWKLREFIGSDEVLGRKNAQRINEDFLRWVGRSRERPFLAFLNYYDAHDPYLPPDNFYEKFAGHKRANQLSPLRRIPVPERRRGVSSAALKIELDSYDASLAYLDDSLGQLFRELERRGLLANTLVVVTADHGEEFGEHGLWYHGNSLYFNALHVPLLMRLPGRVPEAQRVQPEVSLTDLAATIVETAGLPKSAAFPGSSLARFWQNEASDGPVISSVRKGVRLPAWYPISTGDMVSVVEHGKHYIRAATGREELFDIVTDPREAHDLVRSAGADDLNAFRAAAAGRASGTRR